MGIKKKKISAIIIAKNEEEKIGECLKSIQWVDEIVLVDSGSTDATVDIAAKNNAQVVQISKGSYQDWRNEGLSKATGQWVLYIDADERATSELQTEIKYLINQKYYKYKAYAIPRKNIIFGKEMYHTGLWPDYVKRLFLKKSLKKWVGDLHEEPVFEGELGHLKSPFIHRKHSNLSEMVEKTNKWSEVEAGLLFGAKHPQMSWWRFFRVMLTEGWLRLIVQKGYKDGVEGVIYSIYQSWSKFLTYAKLWEMQRNKS